MSTPDRSRLGVVFGSLTPPEQLAAGAELAERLGFGELWFSEDCFFTGGLSGVTQLLASTRSVPVGLGLASIMTRHPAILAMELAGLARMYPGRSRAAIGLGNRHWLAQLGLLPKRPLTAVIQTHAVLRRLLSGQSQHESTHTHEFDDVTLAFPPEQAPELWIGALNERALRAAGATADGVLLSVLAGPAYITWARSQVSAGASMAKRPTPPITAFALASVADSRQVARDAVRDAVSFFVRAEAHTALVNRSPYAGDIHAAQAESGTFDGNFVAADAWLDEFAVAGDPAQVSAQLNALIAAGADSVGLWLFPGAQLPDQLRLIAADVLPKVTLADDER
jgi:alkanesulfonate monooxygenase SsuD/methylene tetrahydromethanopterin reductase-like flavin-dependent oxidoreductase (luciferase family)